MSERKLKLIVPKGSVMIKGDWAVIETNMDPMAFVKVILTYVASDGEPLAILKKEAEE